MDRAKRIINFVKEHLLISLLFVVLAAYLVSLIIPVIWTLLSSLKDQWEFRDNVLGLPEIWAFDNYATVFNAFEFPLKGGAVATMLDMYINSIIYSAGCAAVAVISETLIAYAVASYKNGFSKMLYSIVIVTMIIPIIGSTASEINLLMTFNLYDTFAGVFLLKANFLGMYSLVLIAAFSGLPKAYKEAAKLDGASNLRVMLSIHLPMVQSVLFTVFLLFFINFWNDYQTALLFLPSKPTIAYGVYYFNMLTTNELSAVPYKLAGAMLVFIPIFILFIAFSKRIMGNVTFGGLKE